MNNVSETFRDAKAYVTDLITLPARVAVAAYKYERKDKNPFLAFTNTALS